MQTNTRNNVETTYLWTRISAHLLSGFLSYSLGNNSHILHLLKVQKITLKKVIYHRKNLKIKNKFKKENFDSLLFLGDWPEQNCRALGFATIELKFDEHLFNETSCFPAPAEVKKLLRKPNPPSTREMHGVVGNIGSINKAALAL